MAGETKTSITDQAAGKLDELKAEAGKLGAQMKHSAEEAWEKIKSVDVKAEAGHLKDEAGEIMHSIKEKSKDLWNKLTGDDVEDKAVPEKE
jgi:hypothetical protein